MIIQPRSEHVSTLSVFVATEEKLNAFIIKDYDLLLLSFSW